jgi:hypothetical protein
MHAPEFDADPVAIINWTAAACHGRSLRPMKPVRNAALALAFTLTLIGAFAMTETSIAQTQSASATTTGVMVIVRAKADVTREQVVAVMPTEVRQTVQLYLTGKVREWFSLADGRGAVFLLDTKDIAEAHAIMEDLPLAKQQLVNHEYIAIGPLLPLRLLLASPESPR